MEKAKRVGIEVYRAELDKKMTVLERLLSEHNDGRRKSFYCLAVNLLDLDDIEDVMESIDDNANPKSVVRLFEELSERKSISLKKRKV